MHVPFICIQYYIETQSQFLCNKGKKHTKTFPEHEVNQIYSFCSERGVVFLKKCSTRPEGVLRFHPCLSTEAGVLDEPTQLSQLQRSSYTGPPGYIGWKVDTVPAYVDRRACTATQLSGG
jgi:hypothetical protein